MALLSRLALQRFAVAVLGILLGAAAAGAQTLTQGEALRLVFPGADIERRTAYLEPGQLAAARSAAGSGVPVETGIVTYYLALKGGRPLGVAYFDAHRVRTMSEVLMITIRPDGRVGRIETVSFREPPQYRAPGGWLELFDGRGSGGAAVREVPNISGATLTADAVRAAVRRTLALHAVIAPFDRGGEG